MKKHIDLDNYDRKEQFKFFQDFEEPFFGLTSRPLRMTQPFDFTGIMLVFL